VHHTLEQKRTKMPRRLVAVAPGKAALVDYEEAEVGPDQVKVKVQYASPKHGTEVSFFRGEDPFVADLFDEDWRLFLQREPGVGKPKTEKVRRSETSGSGSSWRRATTSGDFVSGTACAATGV
jgi:threonine dehydrogenase-like Zn-dependent dehydrogenase